MTLVTDVQPIVATDAAIILYCVLTTGPRCAKFCQVDQMLYAYNCIEFVHTHGHGPHVTTAVAIILYCFVF